MPWQGLPRNPYINPLVTVVVVVVVVVVVADEVAGAAVYFQNCSVHTARYLYSLMEVQVVQCRLSTWAIYSSCNLSSEYDR